MKIQKKVLLPLVFAFAVSACSEKEETQAASSQGNHPESASSPAPAQRLAQESMPASEAILIEVNGSDKQPLAFGSKSEFKGTVQAPNEGMLLGVDFKVGTYLNTSDGTLRVEVCNADVCKKGDADIRSSIDNSMFPVLLDEPLDVKAGDALNFSVVKDGGNVPLAVWVYAPVEGTKLTFQRKDGSEFGRVPMIALRYAPRL